MHLHPTHTEYVVALTPRPSIASVNDAEDKESHMDAPINEKPLSWHANPSVRILIGCLLGVIIGYLLGKFNASKEVLSWVSLPGELFLRALTCVVVPLVFVNIFLSVVEMLETGQAAKSAIYTLGYFGITTTMAVFTSIGSVFIFKGWFSQSSIQNGPVPPMTIPCGDDGTVQSFPNGTLSCLSMSAGGIPLLMPQNHTTSPSLSQTIQDQIFRSFVPDNIVQQFIVGNYLGIMSFAMFLACCMQRVTPRPLILVRFCEELNRILLVCIQLIIDTTPLAVLSLVAGGLGITSNISAVLSDLGIFLISFLVAISFHYFVTLMAILTLTLRQSPWRLMKKFWPAQLFAFSCASSAATIPTTMRCAKTSGIHSSISSFVITMGATIHMNGTSIYFPCAIVYLAVSSGADANFNVASYILLSILSMVSAVAAAPVPSSALVLVLPMLNAVCGIPVNAGNFSYLLALDFLLDRFRTFLNISGDVVVALCVVELDRKSSEQSTPESTSHEVVDDHI